MFVRSALLGIWAFLLVSTTAKGPATEWYVDGSVAESGDGKSWETAFKAIQTGINAAFDGDTVTVAPGTYYQNINFTGENITLRSTDPLDPDVVANTIINGSRRKSVVAFEGAEDETCVLTGFTVCQGKGNYGGGIYGTFTHACVRNNVIVNNEASYGGGISSFSGAVQDNVISSNSASWEGGGLRGCDGLIENNIITDNTVSGERAGGGGGLYECHGVIQNNTISGNLARWAGGLGECSGTIQRNTITGNTAQTGGGGLRLCDGVVQSNLIAANHADEDGAGLNACSGIILNNVVFENSAGVNGGGLAYCYGIIRNCIVWGNSAGVLGNQVSESNIPGYSCIEGWGGGGVNNISAHPDFVDAEAGDYHLEAGSPCIDAGVNFYWCTWPQHDLDGHCRLAGLRVDMGCYEHGASLDTDGDLLSDQEELAAGTDVGRDDTDGDGLRDGLEVLRGSSPLQSTPSRTANIPSEIPTIQEALCLAVSGDEIIVAPGTYEENLCFCGPDAVLRSSNPEDPDAVAATILDGGRGGSVVRLTGNETEASTIRGFTIQNGSASGGGGICGGYGTWVGVHALATVRDNVIRSNSVSGSSWGRRVGAGIAFCDGTIQDNTIVENLGSGVQWCQGTIRDNTISGNSGGLSYCNGTIESNTISDNSGMGLYSCDGTIQGNLISGNSREGIDWCHGTIRNNTISGNQGGGVRACEGTIQNNVVTGNAGGEYGGGIAVCDGPILNNLITGNSAQQGGGLFRCDGIIQNNTICANSTDEGGGLYNCEGIIVSCIIWGNMAAVGAQIYDSSDPFYSCIQEWTAQGQGNIPFNPHFSDTQNGDFHLRSWSPCIDAGNPSSPFSNEPQPNGGCINMGAYGDTPEAASKSSDTDGDGLPDDWEMHWFKSLEEDGTGDPDGDLIPNMEEYRQASDPGTAAGTLVQNLTTGAYYPTIQAALAECKDGDEIVVHPGLYQENIDFQGKSVILRSTDPTDVAVVAETIIDGKGTGPVVTFSGDESEACVLSGFTIRNGAHDEGAGICGRQNSRNTKATIENNVITANAGITGGGIAYCDGAIRRNVVYGNSAAREGAGMAWCSGGIQNNTIVRNSGGGVYRCDASIVNCIIWGNGSDHGIQVYNGGTPTYSCIEIWRTGGEGNIAYYPHFVDAENGDYRLRSWSPCIDAGDPSSPFSEEPEPNGGRVNMGAYGNTQEAACKSADSDQDGLPDDWEVEFFGNLSQEETADPDGDLIINIQEYHLGLDPAHLPPVWHVDASVAMSGDGTSWETAFKLIQQGIEAASRGDMVLVAPGVYTENIHFDGKDVRLVSTDPFDPVIVAATAIDANNAGPVITLSGTETEVAAVIGFTLRDGLAEFGGGICGGTEENHNHATIENNRIAGNSADGGGGIAYCDGLIRDNRISQNSATAEYGHGGGAYDCDGIIENNTVTYNVATGDHALGGGLSHCDGTIQNNTISSNSGTRGGGIAYSNGRIQNNDILSNSATGYFGDGGGLLGCYGIVENNTIASNLAEGAGGGLASCGGTVRNNVISGNTAKARGEIAGGGMLGCNGIVEYNTIVGNSAVGPFGSGGGLSHCQDGTIANNIISNNRADNGGGGLNRCRGNIRNNLISRNSASDSGGGLNDCGGTIENNTVVDNSAGGDGSGLFGCYGTIRNCIIWDNEGGSQLSNSNMPSYSCIEGGMGAGQGNLPYYPYFADAAKLDYRLKAWSPCIDAGDPASPFAEEPEPNGGRINMGAYGNTPEATSRSADTDQDGLPDDWELHFFGDLSQPDDGDPDEDLISNLEEYRWGLHPTKPSAVPGVWYVDASVQSSGDGKTWQSAFKTIREGIEVASEGHTIVVAKGLYRELIRFEGKNMVLRSTDPSDPEVVANTIIDGQQAGSVVTFANTEHEACTLTGFTIRNGKASNGGGIYGGTWEDQTHATIQDNVITGNTAGHGGGLAYCGGLIQNNTISANSVTGEYGSGGGLYGCHGTIRNNSIIENTGQGLYGCHGTIRNNLISGNSETGVVDCSQLVEGNTIRGNQRAGLGNCDGTIRNNIVSGNAGGGVSGCDGTIESNTIWGNSLGGSGAGIRGCEGTIRNCIVWGNRAPDNPQVHDSSNLTYSCVQDWMGGGEGNIAFNPYFVDEANGDIHLMAWSPCVDAGDPASPFSNEPEPNGGRVNMGAYGNTPEAALTSPDSDSDGLPDDWELQWFGDLQEAAEGDTDGDDIPNLREYRYAWNPVSPSQTRVTNLTKGTWYETIQVALTESSDGDQIVAHPGLYLENIWFGDRNVVLRSTDPTDSNVVAATIIDGKQEDSVVRFSWTQNEACVLSGFTIQNGRSGAGGGIDGGTDPSRTLATICNNVITANFADGGGAIAYCDGIIRNNLIVGNTADEGGGLSHCDGVIQNNTIVANSGGGLYRCEGTILNCIIWGNLAGRQVSGSPTYSCIEGWSSDDAGNFGYHPYFESAADGDYHLKSWSPCVDAGDPTSPFSEEPLPNGGRANMGAYGNTPEATSKSADVDSDGLPDEWEMVFFGSLEYGEADDPDEDSATNLEEYHLGYNPALPPVTWYVDASVPASGNGLLWETAFKTIQQGIDAASVGDIVVVAKGTYVENICFRAKNITLRGTDPFDPVVVANTIIDGDRAGSVVTFAGTETQFCVLSGFTFRNGSAEYGGAINGGTQTFATHATIRNNVITSNFAVGNSPAGCGGGLAFCGGPIHHNTIAENSAQRSGGGLYECGENIEDNTILGNSAGGYGGGLYGADGNVENNIISTNSSDSYGGGLYDCRGTIQNNIISGNYAHQGGGGLAQCAAVVLNNRIVGNAARVSGGGLRDCSGTILNCVIFGNAAGSSGGGLSLCGAAIRNCIIWANTAPNSPQVSTSHSGKPPAYSCVEGMPDPENHNISASPRFVNWEHGDFHLRGDSPCIGAGTSDLTAPPQTDMDGEHRPFGAEIDIGADEYVDTDGDNLADYWETQRFGGLQFSPGDDPDGDGLLNQEELLLLTDPNRADSDDDGLSDYDEIRTYANLGLNPADSDTDDDALTDGEEINTYGTDPVNPDSEGDGIPDGWEVQYALDPLTADGNEDADGDGLTNAQEFLNSTNPHDSDTDDDGLNDYDEVFIYATDPRKSDSDGDGKDDWSEVIAGTDPLDELSAFRTLAMGYDEDGARIEWFVVPGRTYLVYCSTDLETWFPIGKVRRASEGADTLLHTDMGSLSLRGCFYKIEVRP